MLMGFVAIIPIYLTCCIFAEEVELYAKISYEEFQAMEFSFDY